MLLRGGLEMSDKPKEKRHMDVCNHCGNFTLIDVLWEETHNTTWEETHNPKDELNFFTFDQGTMKLRLSRCIVCSEITLKEVLNYEDKFGDFYSEEKIYYPITKTFSNNLPSTVNRAYWTALKVKPIDPNAFAVSVGRTLEAAYNHERAQGRNLTQKLDFLVQNGRIPKTLAEMAKQLKELRNLGAHDDEDEVTEEDIPIILEFLEAILEYLYVAPAKIEAVRTRLKRSTPPENAVRET